MVYHLYTNYIYNSVMAVAQVLTETSNSGTTIYAYGLERIAAYSDDAKTEYVYDVRGSVAQIVTNNIIESYSYTPFGEQLGEAVSGFGYTAEYYDAATGMQYLRARYYEPEMMRFSQQDLVRGSVVVPISLNRYLYVQNNPVLYSDPSGMVASAAIRSIAVSSAGGAKKAVATNTTSNVTSAAKVTTGVAKTVSKASTAAPKDSTTMTDISIVVKKATISTVANNYKKVAKRIYNKIYDPEKTKPIVSMSTKAYACHTKEILQRGTCKIATKSSSLKFRALSDNTHLHLTRGWEWYEEENIMDNSDLSNISDVYNNYRHKEEIPLAVAIQIGFKEGLFAIEESPNGHIRTYRIYNQNATMTEYIVYDMSANDWDKFCSDYEYERIFKNMYTSSINNVILILALMYASVAANYLPPDSYAEYISTKQEEILFSYQASTILLDIFPSKVEALYDYVKDIPSNTSESIAAVMQTRYYKIIPIDGEIVYIPSGTDGNLYIENWDQYAPSISEEFWYQNQGDDDQSIH